MTPLDPRPLRRSTVAASWTTGLVAAAVVILGSLLVGGLSSFGQQLLPSWVTSLSNSAGGWSMFAFLLVWLSRAKPVLGAILGLVAFEAMVEAYGFVSGLRGFFFSAPFSSRWTVIGLAAGPVIGLAASLTRHGGRLWRVLGVACLSVVLMVEGGYGLIALLGSTSPVYWTIELVAGAAFLSAALVRRGRA
ncbi:hypothetical protein GCM10025867_41420 [Frondihabitans sucicola]|uniref:DUF4386 family protein n=1 Tax=Frondihabitans sucicola TaxID=1268041 RepID=A0ABM8GTU2_9MICO|nr:DUF6518 family protein [Frondihabitans sucicola]BDZ51901.1 hypothetical protein GCM10025867_41420 [Frondihabitans sucicola]